MTIDEAKEEIVALEDKARKLHEQMDELRDEKDKCTRKISALQAFIDAQRPPNPKGAAVIG